MLATCRKEGVSLATERGWRSLMREGNWDDEKLIGDGIRHNNNESDKGGNAATLQIEALAFGLFIYLFIYFHAYR